MIFSHTIWFAAFFNDRAMSVVVEAGTSELCIRRAQHLWDTLSQAGYHMMNTRP